MGFSLYSVSVLIASMSPSPTLYLEYVLVTVVKWCLASCVLKMANPTPTLNKTWSLLCLITHCCLNLRSIVFVVRKLKCFQTYINDMSERWQFSGPRHGWRAETDNESAHWLLKMLSELHNCYESYNCHSFKFSCDRTIWFKQKSQACGSPILKSQVALLTAKKFNEMMQEVRFKAILIFIPGMVWQSPEFQLLLRSYDYYW